jgi:hypothetical protein
MTAKSETNVSGFQPILLFHFILFSLPHQKLLVDLLVWPKLHCRHFSKSKSARINVSAYAITAGPLNESLAHNGVTGS